MKKFLSKTKAIWYILTSKESKFGIVIFHNEPTIGDTLTVGNKSAEFECNMHRIIKKCIQEGRSVPPGLICTCNTKLKK